MYSFQYCNTHAFCAGASRNSARPLVVDSTIVAGLTCWVCDSAWGFNSEGGKESEEIEEEGKKGKGETREKGEEAREKGEEGEETQGGGEETRTRRQQRGRGKGGTLPSRPPRFVMSLSPQGPPADDGKPTTAARFGLGASTALCCLLRVAFDDDDDSFLQSTG
jgi:hypothetical protein